MKKLIYLLPLLTILAFGCENKTTESTTTSTDPKGDSVAAAPEAAATQATNIEEDVTGYYVGEFIGTKFNEGKDPSYVNLINISIDRLGDGKVSGHSVVAGSSRPFSGTYVMEGPNYKIDVAEPGDDKYDGKFAFVLDPAKLKVKGTWVANDKKLAVYEREYELEYSEFKYDPNLALPDHLEYEFLYSKANEFEGKGERTTDAVLKFNASTTKLKKEDVQNMYKGDLEILRNSIYARHGYSFKTRKMRYVFDNMIDWYIPVSVDVSKELTQVEQDNIALIKRYEQHAETYYDEFGR